MFFAFQNLLARLRPCRSAQPLAASRIVPPVTDPVHISLMDVRLASVGIVLAHRGQTQGHSSLNHGGRP